MTTVIFTIIGILLAAVAALMVIFYGGEAFEAANIRAEANQVMNAMTNLHAAGAVYQADKGIMAKDQDDLLGHGGYSYLKEMPTIPNGSVQYYIGNSWLEWSQPMRGKVWVLQIRHDVCLAIAAEFNGTMKGDRITCVVRDDVEPTEDNPGGGKSYAYLAA